MMAFLIEAVSSEVLDAFATFDSCFERLTHTK